MSGTECGKRLQVLLVAVIAAASGACIDVSGGDGSVLSIQFDSLPSPSVVVGDTLRDTTGAVVFPTVRAFDSRGEEIPQPIVRFQAADAGLFVDSVTGIVRGDSVRTTAARIVATVGSLQAVRTVAVTWRPDSVAAINGRDSLQYSLLDSTLNISPELKVKVTHGAGGDTAVASYIVSFAVVSAGDPRLAELVTAGKPSRVDTTDASGIAGRSLRVRPVYMTAPIDSVIVHATVKYRGAPVRGSPAELILRLKPRS